MVILSMYVDQLFRSLDDKMLSRILAAVVSHMSNFKDTVKAMFTEFVL